MADLMQGNGFSVIPELLWHSCDAMMVIDEQRQILAVNPAMEQLTGRKREEFVGRMECALAFACQDLHGCSLAEQPWECPGLRAMHGFESIRTAEYTIRDAKGKSITVSSSYTPIQLPERPVWALVVMRDITLQRRREVRLIQEAKTDPLTGLPNRTALLETLAKETKRAGRHGRPLALGMVDLDGFKQHNDRFGHLAGDDLLKTLAGLLQTGRRLPDMVGRYGGDEFVLILPETDAAGALVVMERLRQAVAQFPFAKAGLTISIGAAVFPEDGTGVEPLLAAADKRLYEAKHLGCNRVVGPK